MTYRLTFETIERRRAKTFTHTLCLDIDACSPAEALASLDKRWPNRDPLPHRYHTKAEPVPAKRYTRYTRVKTRSQKNKYIDYTR